ASGAIVGGGVDGHPINSEGNAVLVAEQGVQPPVVLRLSDLVRGRGGVLADISDTVEATAQAWAVCTDISEILGTERRGKRRADVKSLARDGRAVDSFGESDLGTGGGLLPDGADARSGNSEKAGGDAAGGGHAVNCAVSYQPVAVEFVLLR